MIQQFLTWLIGPDWGIILPNMILIAVVGLFLFVFWRTFPR